MLLDGFMKGRHKSLSLQQLEAARFLYFEERLPLRRVADALGVSHMTVWRSVYICNDCRTDSVQRDL